MTTILSQGYTVNSFYNSFKEFHGRHTYLVGQYKNVCEMFADSISQYDLHFCGFAIAKLIELAKMHGVIHGTDHFYSI